MIEARQRLSTLHGTAAPGSALTMPAASGEGAATSFAEREIAEIAESLPAPIEKLRDLRDLCV